MKVDRSGLKNRIVVIASEVKQSETFDPPVKEIASAYNASQ
jgi:hypothetical protein